MKESHGFWWPDDDDVCATLLTDEVVDLDVAIKLCTQCRTVVQAGGNVGVYPKYLADKFNLVVTAEPSEENFSLLLKNTEGISNISPLSTAFGSRRCRMGLTYHKANCGAGSMALGNEVQVITIDSLALKDVDLIQLDIEGYEEQALMGAEKTIRECQPVIMVEDRSHGAEYGTDDLIGWIEAVYAYKAVVYIHTDVILVPRVPPM